MKKILSMSVILVMLALVVGCSGSIKQVDAGEQISVNWESYSGKIYVRSAGISHGSATLNVVIGFSGELNSESFKNEALERVYVADGSKQYRCTDFSIRFSGNFSGNLTMTPTLTFEVPENVSIEKLALVVENADGEIVGSKLQ